MIPSPILRGFGLGLSLIVAIGAQNAFVLKQGLQKKHVLLVAVICAVSDILLIAAGLGGMGLLIEDMQVWVQAAGFAGIAFLVFYGIRSLWSAFKDQSLPNSGEDAVADWADSAVKALAFTWLNPHVYLDTVVLIGGIGLQFEGPNRLLFGVGAGLASIVWFFSLAYGAARLSPLFAKANTWRGLNLMIAVIMLWGAFWMLDFVT